MTYENSDPISIAGEYVLGTLSDNERADFERQLNDNEQLQTEVDNWQARLAPILSSSDPIAPPADVWNGLEQRLFPEAQIPKQTIWDSLAFWRTLGLSAAALVLVLSVGLFVRSPISTDSPFGSPMVVMNNSNQAGWMIDAPLANSLRVTAIDPTPMPQGKVCRVWLSSPQGDMQPLGDLPDSGWKQLELPKQAQTKSRLMISIEDKASQLTTPTGKVIFTSEPIQF